jgi:16S rRNA (cytidine1402-2'-O)-methyltransferase
MSQLYIVSTPIGNLADITHRAVEVLGTVDRILAEDTRRTRTLLRHYGIGTPLVSAHEHNEAARAEQVVAWLDAGETLALVTDAGTPLISDPGARIVQRAAAAGHTVTPVPGASALLTALVGSGLDVEAFTFLGFTPRSGRARAERLAEIASAPHTVVLYESPVRLADLLAELERLCGGERAVVVARELTKVHETFFRGTLGEAARYYAGDAARGEVVVVVAGRSPAVDAADPEADARARTRALLAQGLRPSAVARAVADAAGIARNRAYELALALAREADQPQDDGTGAEGAREG